MIQCNGIRKFEKCSQAVDDNEVAMFGGFYTPDQFMKRKQPTEEEWPFPYDSRDRPLKRDSKARIIQALGQLVIVGIAYGVYNIFA